MAQLKNPLSISNIAWDVGLDKNVGQLLNNLGVHFIDIAPSKYFKNFKETTLEEIDSVRKKWANYGIEIYGMQSLLYGVNDLNLFATKGDRVIMLSHLEEVCKIGNCLGARFLTFGSPKNRIIGSLRKEEVEEVSLNFFYSLGQIARENNVTICIEPNPKEYGADFLTSTQQATDFVKKLNHSNVKIQFDSGTSILNGENDFSFLENSLIGHVHASTPFLLPLNEGMTQCAKEKFVKANLSENKIICIEMLPKEDTLDSIQTAVSLLREKI